MVRDYCQGSLKTGMSYRYVDYQYTVQGRQYESTREEFGGRSSFPRCEAHFKPGDSTTVYYDPANPEVAVLERGGASPAVAKGIIGLLSMAMSWLVFRLARSRQAQRNGVRVGGPGDSAQDGGRSVQEGQERQPLVVRFIASSLALSILLTPVVFLVVGLRLVVWGTSMPERIMGLVFIGFATPFILVIIARMRKASDQAEGNK